MYSYEWDSSTGGYLLVPTPLAFSKEPRPVYYKELDLLGFDKYWDYDKNDMFPYMWAEANKYYYRGKLVAHTKGGTMFSPPEIIIDEEPEPEGYPLRFIDIPAMVEKNRDIIEQLVQDTIKKTYNTFIEYKDKVDVFYVAFSGGKDSVVTFDIVQRALPHNEFKVLFGDTGMEFPDTYELVEKTKEFCAPNNIEFITAKSDYTPEYTWSKFGPPATAHRWCCSVHKTSPQIISLRQILAKSDFVGMAFIGVRASESVSRNEYDYLSVGEKHKGQYSCNPILDWNSAELYCYIFMQDLPLNNAYKKGNNRAGCLVCPNVSEKNSFFRRACYTNEYDRFIGYIKDAYKDTIKSDETMKDFLSNTGWKVRMNGRDVSMKIDCFEQLTKDKLIIKVKNPKSDWKEWIKTIGVLSNDQSPYIINYKGQEYSFEIEEQGSGYDVLIDRSLSKTAAIFVRYLKNVFHKAGCCILCRECEADCRFGMIKMEDGEVKISDNCHHCSQCHKPDKGCLIYNSLELPKGGLKMENKSLNRYSTHAPKIEWIKEYFSEKNNFAERNSLGSQMFSFFKRFLKDADLQNEDGFTRFAYILDDIDIDNELAWAFMLVNLAYSPQINWYLKNVDFNESTSKEYIISMLVDCGSNDRAATDVFRAFSRFVDLPFSNVGLGQPIIEKNRTIGVYRTGWQNPDERVILYSLYKFAEACGDFRQFTLTRLLDHEVESAGVSPTQIFGLDRETMEKILNSLTFNYPDLIEARFTLGLDNITLKSEKTAKEVLDELF